MHCKTIDENGLTHEARFLLDILETRLFVLAIVNTVWSCRGVGRPGKPVNIFDLTVVQH